MSKKNHYVFFSRTLPFHGIGGMEVLVWDLMSEIVRCGRGKVSVLTTAIPGKPEIFEEEGIHVVAIQGVVSRRYSSKWFRLSADYFDRNLSKSAYCVVSVSMGAAGLLFQRDRFPDVPIICQSHGTSLSETISKLRTKNPIQILKCLRQIKYFIREYKVYKYSNKIVAAGGIVEATLKSFPYCQYIQSDKVVLIENGIDMDEFSPSSQNRCELRKKYNIDHNIPLIVSVARFIKQKGVEQAIYAFNELIITSKDAHLLIVGDGRERKRLVKLVDELNLGDRVIFVGAIKYKDLPMYYQMSDVILFPTLRMEGAPLNILEALSVGLPVVASKHLTNSKQISRYISFVNPRDPKEVAGALHAAIRVSMDEEITLPKKYSIPEMTKTFLHLCDEVINT